MNKKIKISIIGGGSGIFPILLGLKKYFQNIYAIVNMADDGGSSGLLREEFGILPPGDIRRALIALSPANKKILSQLFSYRFNRGKGLSGHNLGNLIILALEEITGSFQKGIQQLSEIFQISGQVVPVSFSKTRLYAELKNGKIIKGETNIDIPKHDGNIPIKNIWLKPKPKVNPKVNKIIMNSDLIIIGPGDLYTSIIPNILVPGLKNSLKKTKAKIVYFVNLMTKFGETNNFQASDFLKTIKKYLGERKIDFLIVNNKKPSLKQLSQYSKETAKIVEIDEKNIPPETKVIKANLLRKGNLIRHDPLKSAKVITKLLKIKLK